MPTPLPRCTLTKNKINREKLEKRKKRWFTRCKKKKIVTFFEDASFLYWSVRYHDHPFSLFSYLWCGVCWWCVISFVYFFLNDDVVCVSSSFGGFVENEASLLGNVSFYNVLYGSHSSSQASSSSSSQSSCAGGVASRSVLLSVRLRVRMGLLSAIFFLSFAVLSLLCLIASSIALVYSELAGRCGVIGTNLPCGVIFMVRGAGRGGGVAVDVILTGMAAPPSRT